METAPAKNIDIAKAKFEEGFNCAQSVLFAFADQLTLNENLALKIASGFGGGIAREQEVCGAFSGAVMALGLFYGRGSKDEEAATVDTYEKIQKLSQHYKDKYGSIRCCEILDGCDLKTEQGQQFFKEKNYFNTKCNECIKTSCEFLAKELNPE